jgi:hypothetical protein
VAVRSDRDPAKPRPVVAGRRRPRVAVSHTAAKPVPRWWGRGSLGVWAQLAGALAAVLYLALLVLYDRFYRHLGLTPEDVGLDRTVILARAVGAVVVLFALAAVIYAALLWFAIWEWVVAWLARWVIRSAYSLFARMVGRAVNDVLSTAPRLLPAPLGSLAGALLPRSLVVFATAAAVLPGRLDPGVAEKPPLTRRIAARIAVLATVSAAGLAFVIAFAAADRAASAAGRGETVTPLSFLGLTVLDVWSVPVSVRWIGPGTTPDELAGTGLHYLGRDSATAYFRDAGRIIGVPAADVIIVVR